MSGVSNSTQADGAPPSTTIFAEHYVLQEMVTNGEHFAVWRGLDQRTGDAVALKFFPPALISTSAEILPLREILTPVLNLRDPRVVAAHQVVTDSDRCAVVTPWVNGSTLTKLRQARPSQCFDVAEIETWMRALIDVLEMVHARGLFHGALHPDNIHVRPGGELCVVGFGIDAWLHLASRAMFGPPESDPHAPYVSPALRGGEPPRVADDVFAFGALVYELLAGSPPREPRRWFLKRRPLPMAVQQRKAGRPGTPIPAAWETVVQGCLEPNTARRLPVFRKIRARLGLREYMPLIVETPAVTAPPIDDPPADPNLAEVAPHITAQSFGAPSIVPPATPTVEAPTVPSPEAEALPPSMPAGQSAPSVPQAAAEPTIEPAPETAPSDDDTSLRVSAHSPDETAPPEAPGPAASGTAEPKPAEDTLAAQATVAPSTVTPAESPIDVPAAPEPVADALPPSAPARNMAPAAPQPAPELTIERAPITTPAEVADSLPRASTPPSVEAVPPVESPAPAAPTTVESKPAEENPAAQIFVAPAIIPPGGPTVEVPAVPSSVAGVLPPSAAAEMMAAAPPQPAPEPTIEPAPVTMPSRDVDTSPRVSTPSPVEAALPAEIPAPAAAAIVEPKPADETLAAQVNVAPTIVPTAELLVEAPAVPSPVSEVLPPSAQAERTVPAALPAAAEPEIEPAPVTMPSRDVDTSPRVSTPSPVETALPAEIPAPAAAAIVEPKPADETLAAQIIIAPTIVPTAELLVEAPAVPSPVSDALPPSVPAEKMTPAALPAASEPAIELAPVTMPSRDDNASPRVSTPSPVETALPAEVPAPAAPAIVEPKPADETLAAQFNVAPTIVPTAEPMVETPAVPSPVSEVLPPSAQAERTVPAAFPAASEPAIELAPVTMPSRDVDTSPRVSTPSPVETAPPAEVPAPAPPATAVPTPHLDLITAQSEAAPTIVPRAAPPAALPPITPSAPTAMMPAVPAEQAPPPERRPAAEPKISPGPAPEPGKTPPTDGITEPLVLEPRPRAIARSTARPAAPPIETVPLMPARPPIRYVPPAADLPVAEPVDAPEAPSHHSRWGKYALGALLVCTVLMTITVGGMLGWRMYQAHQDFVDLQRDVLAFPLSASEAERMIFEERLVAARPRMNAQQWQTLREAWATRKGTRPERTGTEKPPEQSPGH